MDLNIFNNTQYVEWKVKNVMPIGKKYGFRIILTFLDGTQKVQEKGRFKTKKEANDARNIVIAELVNRTYIVNDKVKLE